MTTQEVTAYGVGIEELEAVTLRENAVVGHARYAEKKLYHGANMGNRFQIVVRGLRGKV